MRLNEVKSHLKGFDQPFACQKVVMQKMGGKLPKGMGGF